MKLYKYCTPDRIDVIGNLRMRITPVDQFNDPFELCAQIPDVDAYPREKFDEEIKKSEARQFFFDGIDEETDFEQFQDKLSRDPDFYYDAYKDSIIGHYQRGAKKFQSDYSGGIGIICFSRIPDCILMWSHYTDDHKGFVLEFDSEKMGITHENSIEVEYEEDRVEIAPTLDIVSKEHEEQFRELQKRKHIDWIYEQEVRVHGRLNDKVMIGGDEFYFMDFEPSALTAIYFGCKCVCETRCRAICLCDDIGCNPDYYNMGMHKKKYSLVPKKL